MIIGKVTELAAIFSPTENRRLFLNEIVAICDRPAKFQTFTFEFSAGKLYYVLSRLGAIRGLLASTSDVISDAINYGIESSSAEGRDVSDNYSGCHLQRNRGL